MRRRLADLSIAAKLYLAFGVVAVMLVAVTLTAFHGLSRLTSSNGSITGHSIPKIVGGGNVRYDAADVNGWQTAYVLDRGASRAAFLRSVAAFRRDLATLKSRSVDEIDVRNANNLGVAFDRFMRVDTAVWARMRAGDVTGARRLALGTEIVNYKRLSTAVQAYVKDASLDASTSLHEFASARSSTQTTLLAIAIAALLVAAAAAFLITRLIRRGVTELREMLRALREGGITSLRTATQALAAGDLTVAAHEDAAEIAVRSADEIGQAAAEGNAIREALHATCSDFNQTRAALAELVGDVTTSAHTLASASQQMASTSEETGRAVGDIAAAIADVAQGAARQVDVIGRVQQATAQATLAGESGSAGAAEAAGAAERARTVALDGADAIVRASDAMIAVHELSTEGAAAIRDLGEKSAAIGGIVDTISGIAEQTNLLALNAAIEAARAGDQGRGFAVVADEVRKLAEESQAAAGSIGQLIGEIQSQTRHAVEIIEAGTERTEESTRTVALARESFEAITASVGDVNGRVEEIVRAIDEIAGSSRRTGEEIAEVAAVAEASSASSEQVSASTEQTSASTQQIAASAQELSRTAADLEGLVKRFVLA